MGRSGGEGRHGGILPLMWRCVLVSQGSPSPYMAPFMMCAGAGPGYPPGMAPAPPMGPGMMMAPTRLPQPALPPLPKVSAARACLHSLPPFRSRPPSLRRRVTGLLVSPPILIYRCCFGVGRRHNSTTHVCRCVGAEDGWAKGSGDIGAWFRRRADKCPYQQSDYNVCKAQPEGDV